MSDLAAIRALVDRRSRDAAFAPMQTGEEPFPVIKPTPAGAFVNHAFLRALERLLDGEDDHMVVDRARARGVLISFGLQHARVDEAVDQLAESQPTPLNLGRARLSVVR